jgi:hypothetical protein
MVSIPDTLRKRSDHRMYLDRRLVFSCSAGGGVAGAGTTSLREIACEERTLWGLILVPDTSPARLTTRSYGTTFSGTTLLMALALPRTSPLKDGDRHGRRQLEAVALALALYLSAMLPSERSIIFQPPMVVGQRPRATSPLPMRAYSVRVGRSLTGGRHELARKLARACGSLWALRCSRQAIADGAEESRLTQAAAASLSGPLALEWIRRATAGGSAARVQQEAALAEPAAPRMWRVQARPQRR